MAGRLEGKVVLITGGASGIGAAHARTFAAEGAKILIGDIQDQMGQEVADAIGITNSGGQAAYTNLDVTSEKSWNDAVKKAVNLYGKLTTLINNAGIAIVGMAPTPLVAYAGLVVTGLGGSVIAPTAFAMVGRLSNPAIRAQAIARATALAYGGYFIGPPGLGFMSEFLGLRAALVAMAGVTLLVLVLFPRLVKAGQRGEDRTTHEPVPGCA